MACVYRYLPLAVVICVSTLHGTVKHLPIKSCTALKPSEACVVQMDTSEPVEIGWKAVQSKPCSMTCVQVTQLSGGSHFAHSAPAGGSGVYQPVSDRIELEYRNVSQERVTIDVFRIERICDAEACKFLDSNQKGRLLVFKVDEFKSISTSKDGSYSVISGVAESGRAFRIRAVWWTDDNSAAHVNCSPFIKRYLDNHTPKEQYRPYVMSGQAAGEDSNIVLKSISTCAPHATHYGVSEQNVFK